MHLTLVSLVVLLVVAGVCGAIAQAIVGYSHGGFITSMAIGFIGALLGTWIADDRGLPDLFAVNVGGTSFPIVWSIVGAAIFVAVVSLLTRRRSSSWFSRHRASWR
jgi:uncharacterized membrane protein YeaQ/YmgE (transglycosylase-associated protein family)